jgi:tetratricopeptide (TPR) repeat protein
MFNRTRLIVCVCTVVLCLGSQIAGQQQAGGQKSINELNDRERDGLIGPVRRVTVESAKVTVKNGLPTETKRVLREVTTYDPRGNKIDTVAYPIAGDTLPGKEQYKYDDKGNIVEMQLRSPDGRLLSKEFYKYQMDEVGNWKKMTTSLAVFQDGQLNEEPIEVTYRTITYFYSQEIAKIAATPAGGSNAGRASSSPQFNSGQTKTDIPTLERQTANESEPRFTNTVATDDAISPQNESLQQALLTNTPVPMAQKLSSSSATTPDPKASRVSTPMSAERLPAEEAVSPGSDRPAPSTDSSTDANSLYRIGVAYLESGKHTEAVQTLKEAVHKNPENFLAYVKLGLAYSGLRQYKEAIPLFRMAIDIRPDLVGAEAYYHLGQAYAGIDKPSDAVAAFKQALYITRAEPSNPDARGPHGVPSPEQLHYSLGLAYHRLAKYKDAVEELKKVVSLNPRVAQAHFGLAVCYLALGDRKSAEKQQKLLANLDTVLAQKIAEALSTNRITPPGVTDGMFGSKRTN